MDSPKAKNTDEYIAEFPAVVQQKLQEVRATIREAAPQAEEVISYGMPAFKQHGVLVYFAGYKSHIGFYPTSSGIRVFEKEISKYKWSKGAVQFPLNEKIPTALIAKITKYRQREDAEKQKANEKK